MQHKISPTQLVALLAIYFGESPMNYPGGLYGGNHPKAGTPVWHCKRRMGGAAFRTIEELRDRGFISRPGTRHDPDAIRDGPNRLTVKGYEAIQERLGKLPTVKPAYSSDTQPPFDFNKAVSPIELSKSKVARQEWEAMRDRTLQANKEVMRQKAARRAAEDRRKTVDRFRQLFKDYGLTGWDGFTDERFLEFAEQAGDAVML